MDVKRVFLIVMDSFGIGEMYDAADFGDTGCNTLGTIMKSKEFYAPNLQRLGLFNIEGVLYNNNTPYRGGVIAPIGSFGRLAESSKGKDTTIGHWEIGGIISNKPLPTYPEGFPQEVLDEFAKKTGHRVLCNQPYSGTEVIQDYGEEHMRTGDLIVYTSADSVFQIAAHEDVISVQQLYEYCQIARDILQGEHNVGRVIARPFVGTPGNFIRTANRHDFSLEPPQKTMMDCLVEAGYDTYGVGKIYDIFAGKSIQHTVRNQSNADGMHHTLDWQKKDFKGLCFVNLVDFDMVYGHRRDVDGYAGAVTVFDDWLKQFLGQMKPSDILMITADHGCDPGYLGTDHTREYVPLLVYGKPIKSGVNLGTRKTFSDVAATILELFNLEERLDGTSFASLIKR